MDELTHIDLFTGIGGISIGAEAAGFRTVAFCEIDPFCQAVLRKHRPDVPIIPDICDINEQTLEEIGVTTCDLLSGGFPCQDLSFEGDGAGLAGLRSGLWREMVRTIRVVRPRYALVENVAALLARGMGVILGDLAESGYDAEWDCLPAGAFGAIHFRDRVFVVAYPNGDGPQRGGAQPIFRQSNLPGFQDGRGTSAWAERSNAFEPKLLGNLDGVPFGLDRLRAIGNAVCPPVSEWICQGIKERHHGIYD